NGPRAMRREAAAKMTAIQMPAPVKAWPNDRRKWAYQPGSPPAASVIWSAMLPGVRLAGNIHRTASNAQTSAQAARAPDGPSWLRPAADDPKPVAVSSRVAFGQIITARRT